MPGKVKVKIVAGRNLPVMDRSNDTTDAYVEVKLGSTTFKTDVCRKSLNPQWNSEWFRFEMDDLELQDEPLQIRLMDHDTYSANDAIGKVYLDLNPLLLTSSKDSTGKLISGWIPVYDTMHGIRGEVNLVVKVELFSDLNKFRQSSCGVMFFFTQAIPDGYFTHSLHGFVEELVVNDDPEYQWIDKIRTPRASNEARQTLFSKLSGEVQRRVGLKALELGGNAVIGYRQCFDLEGESGIVVRGIGTAATLVKQYESQLSPSGPELIGTSREFQSVDDGLLLPFSSHPSKLSKTSRSKRTGSRVPTSTHSMPETMLLNQNPNSFHKIHSASSSLSVTCFPPLLPYRMPGLLHDHECSARTYSLAACQHFDDSNASKAIPHHHETHNSISKSPVSLAKQNSHPKEQSPNVLRKLNSSKISTSSRQEDDRNDSSEFESEIAERVKFKTGGESLSSLSGMDTENKTDDGDVEDDDEEEKKVNSKENNFALLLMHRKPRGSRKKDRYSKSSLLKRASVNFADSKRVLGDSKGKETFTDEIVKFFKRKKFLLGDKGETSSLSDNTSPYRKPKSSIFRRRQKFRGNLHRCNSESFSLGQTSLDSLPSIQSELVFDDDTDSNSLESLPSNINVSPFNTLKVATSTASDMDVEISKSNLLSFLKTGNDEMCSVPEGNNSEILSDCQWIDGGLQEPVLADPTSTARMISAVKELGYGMEKPLKLYISSADALLIYDPVSTECRNVTHTTNVTANNNETAVRVSNETVPTGGSSSIICSVKRVESSLSSIKQDLRKEYTSDLCTPNVEQTTPNVTYAEATSDSSISQGTSVYSKSLIDSKLSMESRTDVISTIPTINLGLKPRDTKIASSNLLVPQRDSSQSNIGPLACVYRPTSSGSCRMSYHSRSFSDSSSGMSCNPNLSLFVPKERNPVPETESAENRTRTNINSTLTATALSGNSQLDVMTSVHGDTKGQNEPVSFARSCSSNSVKSSCNCVTASASTAQATTIINYNTTTTTNITSTATITDAIINVSLSSITNASSTNLPPAPSATVTKSISSTNGSSSSSATTATQCPSNATASASTQGNSNDDTPPKQGSSNSKGGPTVSFINRRSSESDLSSPPKPITANTTTVTTVLASGTHGKTLTFAPMPPRRLITTDHFEMLEYPFITLNQLPPGFIQHLGGTVSARSVKLLERITNLDEPESRDSWWTEIRMEIRSHARSIGCNIVLGYEEQTTMCDDVCVLSASGTAALVTATHGEGGDATTVIKIPGVECLACVQQKVDKDKTQTNRTEKLSNQENGCGKCCTKFRHSSSEGTESICHLCHIPYNESSVPFPVKMTRCLLCKKGKVPDILLATIDLPAGLQTYGKSCLIQAQVFRPKKDCKGEISAKEVSDSLPFLEYELHRRLINKLKVRGMNAIFALQVQISLGEKLLVGLATGTAVFLRCLPAPSVPKISAGNLKTDSQKVIQFQKVVQEVFDRNREVYNLKNTVPAQVSNGNQSVSSDGEESDEDLQDIDLATGNKDTYVLEVDDAEDIDIIQVLIDPSPELGFYMNNINFLHGFENYRVTSQQMFTQVWRCRISPLITLRQFTNYFDKLLQAVAFKLRRISPCVLSKLRYRVELPEQDEMQLSIIGLAVKLEENPKAIPTDIPSKKVDGNGEILQNTSEPLSSPNQKSAPIAINTTSPTLGASHSVTVPDSIATYLKAATGMAYSAPTSSQSSISGPTFGKCKIPRHIQVLGRPKCIEITPLSHIPGGKIDSYLGNLNFFFIRETTSIREVGGLSGFVHSFIAEVLAIVRAHVAALGGNAMVSYFMTELALLHNPHKNQGQCLVNVGGDVVLALYPSSLQDVWLGVEG
ncbi:unnamed protein product [Allacma fusca]|uniref:C2 domain-containing protein n=1 Tax=Allacma fusca TaxID=39272 RepID=A0A8J2PY50_9HEXA|nr:unnamed protein product [Allacma fusca]